MAKLTSDIDYVQYALDVSYDDRYYYAHSSDPFAFSCSTLVGHSLYVTKYVKTDPRPADGHAIGGEVLNSYFKEAGFKWMSWAKVVNSGGMKPGDALIVDPYHVAWHVKNGIMVAANGNGDMVDHSPTAICTYDYRLVGTPKCVWRPTEIHSPKYEFKVKTIKEGAKGQDVRLLQQNLRGWNIKDPKTKELIKVDGSFGEATKRTLIEFQKKTGYNDGMGICGQNTWKRLLRRGK